MTCRSLTRKHWTTLPPYLWEVKVRLKWVCYGEEQPSCEVFQFAVFKNDSTCSPRNIFVINYLQYRASPGSLAADAYITSTTSCNKLVLIFHNPLHTTLFLQLIRWYWSYHVQMAEEVVTAMPVLLARSYTFSDTRPYICIINHPGLREELS